MTLESMDALVCLLTFYLFVGIFILTVLYRKTSKDRTPGSDYGGDGRD